MSENQQAPVGFIDLTPTRQFAGNPGVSTLYAWMAAGDFPRPYCIGANRRAWKISELEAWRDTRPRVEYRSKQAA